MSYLKCLALAAAAITAVVTVSFSLALLYAAIAEQKLGSFLLAIVLLTVWLGTFIHYFWG